MRELLLIRQDIDSLDRELSALLETRRGLVKEVGEYKKNNNLPIFAPEREVEKLAKTQSIYEKAFVTTLMRLSRFEEYQNIYLGAKYAKIVCSKNEIAKVFELVNGMAEVEKVDILEKIEVHIKGDIGRLLSQINAEVDVEIFVDENR